MKTTISEKSQNGMFETFFPLNAGVVRFGLEESKLPKKYRNPDVRCIVRSRVAKNGDIYEETELLDPDSIPHPLSGVVYDPAVMSLTAQLSAGANLKEVSIGQMYNDPLTAERLALSQYSVIESSLVAVEVPSDAPADAPADAPSDVQ